MDSLTNPHVFEAPIVFDMASFKVSRLPIFLLKLLGNVSCIVILMIASFVGQGLTFIVDNLICLIATLTKASISRDEIPMPQQRVKNEEIVYFPDSIMEVGARPQIIGKT